MTVPRRIRDLQDVPRPVVAVASDYPADHEIAPHSHPRSQLIYAERGVMTVTTGIGVWVIPPQRAVWVPGGMEHRVDAAATTGRGTSWRSRIRRGTVMDCHLCDII